MRRGLLEQLLLRTRTSYAFRLSRHQRLDVHADRGAQRARLPAQDLENAIDVRNDLMVVARKTRNTSTLRRAAATVGFAGAASSTAACHFGVGGTIWAFASGTRSAEATPAHAATNPRLNATDRCFNTVMLLNQDVGGMRKTVLVAS